MLIRRSSWGFALTVAVAVAFASCSPSTASRPDSGLRCASRYLICGTVLAPQWDQLPIDKTCSVTGPVGIALDMKTAWWWAIAAALTSGAFAMGGGCVPLCTPGSVQACACTSGLTGAQLCRSDGYFDPCRCTGTPQGGGFATTGGGLSGGFGGFEGGGMSGFGGGSSGPRLTAPRPPSIVVGDPFTLSVTAMPPATSWSWTVTGPGGASLPVVDATSATPAFTAALAGQHLLTVTARNAGGETTLNFPVVASEGRLLAFKPTSVANHRATNRLALGRELPSSVEVFDVVTAQSRTITVSRAPISLAFTPDGTRLLVGQVAQLQVISFTGATPQVVATWPLSGDPVSLTANATHGYWVGTSERDVNWVRLDTGETGSRYYFYSMGALRMHPDELRFYGANRGGSRDDVVRFDIDVDGGGVSAANDSRYHGDYAVCGEAWLSRDGTQLVSSCGVLFRISRLWSDDLVYGGRIPQQQYRSVDESIDGGAFIALAQLADSFRDSTEAPLLMTVERSSLRQSGVRLLPSRLSSLEGQLLASHVFVDAMDKQHVLLVGGAGVPSPRAVWLTFTPGVP